MMLGLLVAIVACVFAVPFVVVGLECVLSLLPVRRVKLGPRAKIVVLIPAHDEEPVIGETLDRLLPTITGGDRVLVVADNCTDRTAAIARSKGVEVIERFDEVNRGKGFALAAGVAHMQADPPKVVVVVDADCRVEPGALEKLARMSAGSGRPVQAVYLMEPPKDAGIGALVSTFAFVVKNQPRARGLHRLGLPVLLTGTGMAFPWAVLTKVDLATGNLVEDLAIGLEMTERGYGPLYGEPAAVWGKLPSGKDAAVSQRTRWEHGYLSTIVKQCPWLVWRGLRSRRLGLWVAALDLAVPPLSLLVMQGVLVLAVASAAAWFTGVWWGVWVLGGAVVWCGLGLMLAWARFARKLVPGAALLGIPWYMLSKVPIYLRFIGRRQKAWVRTERDEAAADAGIVAGDQASGEGVR